ncbi:MAG: hypothetical protein HQL91_12335 [Magnetococcales bacterium]|nr:hypothetical protein [Magnetococcales bacterium]
MSGRLGGVTRHEVRLDGAVPVAVEIALAGGVEAVVDLVTREVIQLCGASLKPRQMAWLVEIAEFLARQHLLEAAEMKREALAGGGVEIAFEPRPRPGMIWWG